MVDIPIQPSRGSFRFRHSDDLIAEVLTVLAGAMMTTIVVIMEVAYWFFGAEPGWIVLAVAGIVGVVVTAVAMIEIRDSAPPSLRRVEAFPPPPPSSRA
jgi:hypothetical protein